MIKNFVTFDLDDQVESLYRLCHCDHAISQDASSPAHNGLFAWPAAGEVAAHGQTRPSHHDDTHYSQHQQQQQFSQPSGSAWAHAGRGVAGDAAVDPWGRPYRAGSSADSDIGSSQVHGMASWNRDSSQSSAHNGWFGGYNRNDQQLQLPQPQADHRISQYVVGLPAEIIDQVSAFAHVQLC
jgi:hypothetical protein